MNTIITRALSRVMNLGTAAAGRPDEPAYPRLIQLAWRDFHSRRDMLLAGRAAVRQLNTAGFRYVMGGHLERPEGGKS